MTLAPGHRLGVYEIVSPIGEGGMGQVYRATDTKLKRQVAIKILPPALAVDAGRLARFQREAEVLASLNHPHIAQIYGMETGQVGPAGHLPAFIVMELVEGEDLAQRIARGAMQVHEALAIVRQIVDALDAAHGQGIVHRDLKPANVRLRADGTVKVLDFGLAKTAESAAIVGTGLQTGSQVTNSPTITSPAMTQAGMILGTAAYMSPEQAKGRAVDKRSDIWAFGCVLIEMLTGRRAFKGDDVSDTLASILKDEPNWNALPPRTPPSVEALLKRCLEKDPRRRLRDIGDALLFLDDAGAATSPAAGSRRPLLVAWAAAGAFAALALGMFFVRPSPTTPDAPFTLTVVPPDGTLPVPVGGMASAPEIAPDGSAVLFATGGPLYVRGINALGAVAIPKSEEWNGPAFWSADSQWIAYPTRSNALMRARLPDGEPERVAARLPGPTRQGSWSDAGDILLASFGQLWTVRATGGEFTRVQVESLGIGVYATPQFLPGGRDVVFSFRSRDSGERLIYLGGWDGSGVTRPIELMRNETGVRFTPAGGGRLLFVVNDNLYEQPLNLRTRQLEGERRLIASGVASQPGNTINQADFSVSRDGLVAWRPGRAALSQVTVFDRTGTITGTIGQPLPAYSLALTNDEGRLLISGGRDQAWVVEVDQAGRRPLPSDTLWFGWSADGVKVIGIAGYENTMPGTKREMIALSPGAANTERLIELTDFDTPFSVSSDGLHALGYGTNSIVAAGLDGSGTTRVAEDIPGLAFRQARFSPDGRWVLASASVEGKPSVLLVQPFAGPGRRVTAAENAAFPEWRGDGKEIVYFSRDRLASIAVSDDGRSALRFGAPVMLTGPLRLPSGTNVTSRPIAVSRDGSRVYFLQGVEQPATDVIHINSHAFAPRP